MYWNTERVPTFSSHRRVRRKTPTSQERGRVSAQTHRTPRPTRPRCSTKDELDPSTRPAPDTHGLANLRVVSGPLPSVTPDPARPTRLNRRPPTSRQTSLTCPESKDLTKCRSPRHGQSKTYRDKRRRTLTLYWIYVQKDKNFNFTTKVTNRNLKSFQGQLNKRIPDLCTCTS